MAQGQCVPRNGQNGGSFFTPLLGPASWSARCSTAGSGAPGLYHDRRDGGYYTGYGGRLGTDYRTGRTQIGVNGIDPPAAIKASPPKIQTRTSVLSRGRLRRPDELAQLFEQQPLGRLRDRHDPSSKLSSAAAVRGLVCRR